MKPPIDAQTTAPMKPALCAKPSPPARAGISLLAIVATLLVLAALAVAAIPAFFESPSVTLENAGRLLARDLRAAQNLAAFRRSSVFCEFSERGYRMVGTDRQPVPAAAGEPGSLGRSYDRFGIFDGVTVESVDVGPAGALEFTGSGEARAGAALVLAFRGHRLHARITPDSGQVELSRDGRSWWLP